jgi:hypothetical protein
VTNQRKVQIKKIEYTDGLKQMFRTALGGDNHERFSICHHRYWGCGVHLYLLTNVQPGKEALDIFSQRVRSDHMVEWLSSVLPQFLIVSVDVEMVGWGGAGAWDEKGEVSQVS